MTTWAELLQHVKSFILAGAQSLAITSYATVGARCGPAQAAQLWGSASKLSTPV